LILNRSGRVDIPHSESCLTFVKAIPALSTLPLGAIPAIDTAYTPSICSDIQRDEHEDEECNFHEALLWA
jgi:hypothetical protein